MPRTTPLITAKQFARLPDFIGELWDGVAEVADASSGWSSAVGIRIARRLAAYVDRRRLGWVFGEQAGFHVRRHPDRVLSPDVAFVALARLPRMPETGFVPVVPDLVVEVRSPSDPWLETIKKGGIWLGHGAPLVWCVDPSARRVAALRLDGPPEMVGPVGVLRADPVLPRFRLPVAEIFRHPA